MSWRVRIRAVGPSASTAMRQACRGLVGVGRTDHPQSGHGPHRGQLLDGLVGGPVLAEPDRVVGPRVDDVDVREGGEPHRPPHVVAEDEEGAADREQAAVGGHAGHDAAHPVLADAVVDEVAARLVARLRLGAVPGHPGVAGQVGAARA